MMHGKRRAGSIKSLDLLDFRHGVISLQGRGMIGGKKKTPSRPAAGFSVGWPAAPRGEPARRGVLRRRQRPVRARFAVPAVTVVKQPCEKLFALLAAALYRLFHPGIAQGARFRLPHLRILCRKRSRRKVRND